MQNVWMLYVWVKPLDSGCDKKLTETRRNGFRESFGGGEKIDSSSSSEDLVLIILPKKRKRR